MMGFFFQAEDGIRDVAVTGVQTCALPISSILWRSADQAPEAADVLGITAGRLKTLGLIDKIVAEPLGGAHRDPQATAQALRKALAEALKQLQEKKPKELVEQR